jgi:phage-related tail protein
MANSGVNIKIGVSGIADFKRDINSAKQQIKTMDADLALVEKQFRATGDAEAYMQQKTDLLKGKLEAQKSVLEKAESALKAMKFSKH